MYDYKSYLIDNKYLLGVDKYIGKRELLDLTASFLKKHLDYLNEKLKDGCRKIYVCFYEDNDRINFSKCLVDKIYQIIDKEKDKNLLLGFQRDSDVHFLLRDDIFVKINKSVLKSDLGNVDYKDITKIKDYYDVIILPYLIKDIYHRDMFCLDDMSYIKMLIYMAFSYCKDSLYLLCPISRKDEYSDLFDKLMGVLSYE